MSADVLTPIALNRALLARQHLLQRTDTSVPDMIEHLVGLQAQATLPPYYGLWSRLDDFDPTELGRLLTERAVVRLTLMRGTIHLVTVRDAAFLRPLLHESLIRKVGPIRRQLGAGREAQLPGTIREILANEPLGARELARRLVELGFGDDPTRLGYAVPAFLPLVQLPPRGVLGEGGQVLYSTFEDWTGLPLRSEPSIDTLILRYLRAFGPASVMDMQNWSGLTKLRTAFERLRPQLFSFRDASGTELFDLPDAPRPDPDVTAPVRLLGEYDNLLLGHRDRSRIIPADFPWKAMLAHGRFVNNLLVDGVLRATWWIEQDGSRHATLGIRPFRRFTTPERIQVEAEASRMLDFAAPEARTRDVKVERAVSR